MSFLEIKPRVEDYWRAIILFGKNTSSYKFALAKALLSKCTEGKSLYSLEELALPYASALIDHLKLCPKQATSPKSSFIDSANGFIVGAVSQDQLIDATIRHGFKYVLNAFHVVNREPISTPFFLPLKKNKGIELTDEYFHLVESFQLANLPSELEARWKLVEAAWSLNLSPHMLTISLDNENDIFFIRPSLSRRIDLTPVRDALNGYQKGKCFYCFKDITVTSGDENRCDIDHFFPKVLMSMPGWEINLDGVWNLVLSCQNCNRGSDGKFTKIPEIKYLYRLETRNNFFIDSHHPLRETLINQTGLTSIHRHEFLKKRDTEGNRHLIHRWNCKYEFEARF